VAIIFDLPFGFPINNIISLRDGHCGVAQASFNHPRSCRPHPVCLWGALALGRRPHPPEFYFRHGFRGRFFERESRKTHKTNQWVTKRRELPGFAGVNKVTSASLGYPLSVFNKNSTRKKVTHTVTGDFHDTLQSSRRQLRASSYRLHQRSQLAQFRTRPSTAPGRGRHTVTQ